jgi:hypothetical protein
MPNDHEPRLSFTRRDRPPDRIRGKLLWLLSLLLVVLILMRLAGHPNAWHWMNFSAPDHSASQGTERQEPLVESPPPVAALRDSDDAEIPQVKIEHLEPELKQLERDFWARAVRRLDDPSRLRLFAMTGAPPASWSDAEREARANVVERIQQHSDRYRTDLLTQSGGWANSDPARKQVWYDLLFFWQKRWNESIAPALATMAGQAPSNPDVQATIAELAELLSDIAKSMVLDDAPLGRATEVPYWNELLSRLKEAAEAEPAEQALPVELRAQPSHYRGRRIAVRGRIRGARIQLSGGAGNGVDQYFELWVQPEDGSAIPYCVYALEVPADFPPLSSQLAAVDIPTRIEGYFFKTRSYLTANSRTQFAPVVVAAAPTIEITLPTTSAARPPAPFRTLMTILTIALLAAWVAWRVYRSYDSISRREPRFRASLWKDLAEDPRVVSTRERLARLETEPTRTPASLNRGGDRAPNDNPL